MEFICDITFPSWSGKSINPHFTQYQSYKRAIPNQNKTKSHDKGHVDIKFFDS